METDPYEGVNLYLSMSGNLSDPKIKYDKASSRKKMQNDFKREKENLKNLINNTSVRMDENEKKREERYFNTSQQPQFMDFDSTGN
jgi:predicted solute-binding protein